MRIGFENIDNFIFALAQNRLSDNTPIEDFSLGAAAEFAIWGSQNCPDGLLFRALISKHSPLREACRLLNGGLPNVPLKPYARIAKAFYPVRLASVLTQLEWNQFLERFAASLKEHGFVNDLHQALAKALSEMADNIVQHSVLGSPLPLNGFAAYHVADRWFSFAVADVGIGALKSLQDNPNYAGVSNAREALDLIAREKASRRTDRAKGGGYSDLLVSLASFDGRVRLRSSDGVFTMEGALDRCKPMSASLHEVPGFQVSVECRI